MLICSSAPGFNDPLTFAQTNQPDGANVFGVNFASVLFRLFFASQISNQHQSLSCPLSIAGYHQHSSLISVIDIWIFVMLIYISLPSLQRNIAQQSARYHQSNHSPKDPN